MNFISSGWNAERSLPVQQTLPEALVCWSRMQAEAGQQLDTIIKRKELERRANNGVFLWGVGNAPAKLTRSLARTGQPVRAIFSIMKSKPRAIDADAEALLLWQSYVDADGIERSLPANSVVTSRAGTGKSDKRAHYALMCQSDRPLQLARGGARFDPAAFRNAGENGGPVGASQVTALLRQVAEERRDAPYEVNMEARLAAGYWVRLTSPIAFKRTQLHGLDQVDGLGVDDWRAIVGRLRRGGMLGIHSEASL